MTSPKPFLSVICLLATSAVTLPAQAQAPAKKSDKSAAYYHYSLGHLYAELAGAYANRSDYVTKAIENYRLAMREDPTAAFLSEELSDLYIASGKLREAMLEAEEALKQNPNDLNARRILGRIYTRKIGDSQPGKIDENMLKLAIEQYQKITEQAPNDADTWLMLGRLQKIASNSVEAEKAYKKVIEVDPDNEDALTGLAMVYADLGNSKAATELLRRVADKSPSLRTLTALAGTYEQMRDYALAAETLKKTMELSPGNVDVKRAYAQNLLLSDQYADALKVYKELVAEDPKDVQSQLRISQIYLQLRDFPNARDAVSKAKNLEPDNLEVRFHEVTLMEAESKYTEAIGVLKELLLSTAHPKYSPPERGNRAKMLDRLARLYRLNEQPKEAAETLRQMGDLDPDLAPRASAEIIETYRLARDYKKASEEADAATKKYPNDRLVRISRSSLLADLGKNDEAVAETKKLLDGKNDRETYLSLAQIYDKAKNFTEMGKAIDAAEKLSDSPEEKESIAFMRGAMYEKMKKYDLAEAEFKKVLAANPNNASALNYLGYMLADRNIRLQEAHQMISKALESDPNNGAYLDSLGWAYFRMDKLADAERTLRHAVERYSKDPTVHDHLGDVLFKQGKVKEAIAQWQMSLKEWDNTPPTEMEPVEVAKVQKKLEGARVRLAKEPANGGNKQQ
jgi:tetratricopeptide (TPR) repeat protein